jgi:3-oxoacyl-[acyl-carrier-protein] synthase II
MAIARQSVPATANHETTDPELAIDVVHGASRSVPSSPAVSNSFGFGGHNASIVLGPTP